VRANHFVEVVRTAVADLMSKRTNGELLTIRGASFGLVARSFDSSFNRKISANIMTLIPDDRRSAHIRRRFEHQITRPAAPAL
jgi:hypothetical protein